MGSMPVGLRREEEVESWYTPIVWPIRSTASASHLDSRRTIVWWIRSTATAIQLVSRMAIRTQNSTNTKSSLTLRSTCFLFPWEYKHCQAIEWISKALLCLHFPLTLQTDFICFVGIICMFIHLKTMHSNFKTLYIFS